MARKLTNSSRGRQAPMDRTARLSAEQLEQIAGEVMALLRRDLQISRERRRKRPGHTRR